MQHHHHNDFLLLANLPVGRDLEELLGSFFQSQKGTIFGEEEEEQGQSKQQLKHQQ